MNDGPTRRSFLLAGTAAVAALAGCTGEQEGTESPSPPEPGGEGEDGQEGETSPEGGGPEANDTAEQEGTPADTRTGQAETIPPDTEIRLGGETQAWVSQAPDSIADEQNPRLVLEEGATYTITWENLDGKEHELILEDENANEVAATESSESQGDTRSTEFQAGAELASYYCEYHPNNMRGTVQVSGQGG